MFYDHLYRNYSDLLRELEKKNNLRKKNNLSKKNNFTYLPTLFFLAMLGEPLNFFLGLAKIPAAKMLIPV